MQDYTLLLNDGLSKLESEITGLRDYRELNLALAAIATRLTDAVG